MYEVTNKSRQKAKIPGSPDLFIGAGETLLLKGSSFSLSLTKLNKLFTVNKLMTVQPKANAVKSSKPAVELNKQKRVRRNKSNSAQTPKISGKVSNDG